MTFNIKYVASAQILALTLGLGSAHAQATTDKSVYKAAEKISTPESVLPDGVDTMSVTNPFTGRSRPARKGTVAATLNNVALLNTKLQEKNITDTDWTLIQEIQSHIIKLLPSLDVIGVFDLFDAEEWISDTQLGRTMTITLYLKENPSKVTDSVKKKLKSFLVHNDKKLNPKVMHWFKEELKPLI